MINLKEKWESLGPEAKKKVALFGILGVFGLMVLLTMGGGEGKKPVVSRKKEAEVVRRIELKTDLLESSLYNKTTDEMKAKDEELQQLKKRFDDLAAKVENQQKAGKEPVSANENSNLGQESLQSPPNLTLVPGKKPSDFRGTVGYPQPPIVTRTGGTSLLNRTNKSKKDNPFGEPVGGIGRVTVVGSGEEKKPVEEEKRKSVLIPLGFMEATLITGADAKVIEKAAAQPVPLLLRVKAPAQLPNDVRANLRGCLVVAEGKGELATERIDVRTVRIACIDKKGKYAIEEEIDGYVADEDGKVGLKGRPVAKFGQAIARMFLAGMMEGFGTVAAESAQPQTETNTATGVTTTTKVSGEELSRAGIGKGLATAAEETQKFYLELARMAMPVIETMVGKKVTLVLKKGFVMRYKEF